MALRRSSTRPLPSVQTCARPVLSWAARWKGSAAPAEKKDEEKKPIEKMTAAKSAAESKGTAAAADKVTPEVKIPSTLPVTFEVKRKDASEVRFKNYQSLQRAHHRCCLLFLPQTVESRWIFRKVVCCMMHFEIEQILIFTAPICAPSLYEAPAWCAHVLSRGTECWFALPSGASGFCFARLCFRRPVSGCSNLRSKRYYVQQEAASLHGWRTNRRNVFSCAHAEHSLSKPNQKAFTASLYPQGPPPLASKLLFGRLPPKQREILWRTAEHFERRSSHPWSTASDVEHS